MCWNGHMGMGGGWMGIGWLVILLLIVAVVWFVFSASRPGDKGGQPVPRPPEEALKDRYARGEIDKETYERMLEDLRK